MNKEILTNKTQAPYQPPLCSEQVLQSGNRLLVKKTKPDTQYSQRFSDRFYEYDIEHGTQLKERKIETAYAAWALLGLITTLGTYTAVLVTAASLTLAPLHFLSIPICAAVITVCAVVFHVYITSKSSHQHAQQVLGPKTQEQANTLQCKAVEVCKQKQAEINDLQAINDSIRDDIISVLDNDTCKEDSKCEDVDLSRYTLLCRNRRLLRQYLINKNEISLLQSSVMNLAEIYHLSINVDDTGQVNVKVNKAVNLEDLAQ